MKKILTVILLALFTQMNSYAQKGFIQLEDIWGSRKLTAKTVSGFNSMNNGEHYTNSVYTPSFQIVKYAFKDGKAIETILTTNDLVFNGDTISVSSYSFSPDEHLILIATNTESIYRHSSKSDYFIFNRLTKQLSKITQTEKVMYCQFSPDNTQLAYVKNNNLYIYNLQSKAETAVTTDGKKNSIINGATDWVYEEEFSMDVAYQWSPDGKKLAYYKFDESNVKEFNLTYYGDLYPKEEKYKYPKAGEENSKVEIYVYDINSKNNSRINTGTEREYIPRIKWTKNPSILSIQTLNRHQNHLELLFYNTTENSTKAIIKEDNSSFIEITDDLTFLENGNQFIWTSTRDGYNHIYLYSMDGKQAKQITKGNFEVSSYYGYDENKKTFYYLSTELSPTERYVYAITNDGKKTNLTPEKGTHNASFSNGFKYFIDTYSSYGKPYTCSVINNLGKTLRILEDNRDLKAALQEYHLGKTKEFTFKNKNGVEFYGWMIYPPDFDSTLKYPVLINVYGGPGVQTVTNDWDGPNYLWHQMLAQRGYIIASIENRGTPGRGLEWANCIYKDLGKLEVDDQISGSNYIKGLPYVENSRMGVWGWSFGGYMTSLLMTKVHTQFKLGIAVAPVTNWRYYDNIYTERYLQTPQENADGYDKNSPTTYAKDLKGKFLLIHGSADDNVHMQNSMDFINALVKYNKQFDLFIYPNRNHGIYGDGARLHLYTKMTDFIINNL
ncbi:MAG: S9 family peptidase [Bacteroidota bacterium]